MLARRAVGHAAVGPRSPRDRGSGQAPFATPLRQRIQIGVGRAVGGLPAASPDAGDRGEQHECVKLPLTKEFVEMCGTGDLRPRHPRELLVAGLGQRRQLSHARRVHDPGQRQVRRNGGEQVRQRRAIRYVTRRDGDCRAQSSEFGVQLSRPRRVRAAATHQQQVLRPLAREPASDVRAQRPGAAGHEHGAARCPLRTLRPGVRIADQSTGVDPGGSHRELIFACGVGQHRQQPSDGTVVECGGQVDEPAPQAWPLQCHRTAHAPDGCL